MNGNLRINQEVLHDNKEIFSRIETELKAADLQIQVATAWFTDEVLFNTLVEKASQGVKVEVIIADNAENEKLDFSLLTAQGATVIRIKNVGYGIMHQKFCIIDKKKAIHGSYNWSNNAKNNNHESIIITDHQGTVESLLINFNNIRERAKAILAGVDLPIDKSSIDGGKLKIVEEEQSFKTSYEEILDSMISAEISSFNRDSLWQQGYNRAKSNNGDHQVLYKAFDTLYNGFINDIDVVEDKKRRLVSKIDQEKAKADNALRERVNLQIEAIKEQSGIAQNKIDNQIIALKAELLIGESAIIEIKKTVLPYLQSKVDKINDLTKDANLSFVKPGVKWFELITISLISLGLLVYLVMFYSSAAYILLYSESDAILQSSMSSAPLPQQVFEPKAFSRAWEHGGLAIVFICLFVLIPIAFSLLARIMENKKIANWLTFTVGFVAIDFFIAVKVSQSIFNINSKIEKYEVTWSLKEILTDINFYLVFILGALGLLLFKYSFEKLNRFFDERNPDIAAQRNKLFLQQKKEEIATIEEDIFAKNKEVEDLQRENIRRNNELKFLENELANIPSKRASQIEVKKHDLNLKIQAIDATTVIYKSHIENDHVPVSVDALKDRINVFLEGWNDYLFEEYASLKASEKLVAATKVALDWENDKLNRSLINSRSKIWQ